MCILMLLRFAWLFVLGLYKEDYLQVCKCVSVRLHSFCGKWEGWDPFYRFNHTSSVAIVTCTHRATLSGTKVRTVVTIVKVAT